MAKVSYDELVGFGTRLLVKLGASPADAAYMARTAAVTEAGGVQTHGAVILPVFAELVGSTIDPKKKPAVVAERGSTATIDGEGCFSLLAMRLATEIATAKARANGVAMVAVRNTCWIGGLGAHLLPIVAEGFFAQLWAQSCQCQDAAPAGGIDARLSTNPLAIAIPTDGGSMPILADFSTAVYSMGKLNTMARAGQKAPEPVFLDKDGNFTDDPKAVADGGAMLMFGGAVSEHKGYSLSLWCEALVAMAGGNCNDPTRPSRQNFNLTVIDPAAFGPTDHYRKEITRLIGHVKTSRPRKGVDQIRLPGERMLQSLARGKAGGVELAAGVLDRLNKTADQCGVPRPRMMD